MKKITLLSLALLLAGTLSVSAQGFYYGPKAGLNLSSFTKTSFSKSRLRAHVGAFGGYQIDNWIAVQAEALYSWQGSKNDDTDVKTSMNYFKIPILAKFFIIRGLNVETGISFDFRTAAKTKYDSETHTIKGATKGFDFSIPIGINYQFARRFDVGLRYYVSTARLSENSHNKAKNSNCMLSVGFRL